MKKLKLLISKQGSKQKAHQWVMFRNPRNNVVQISACKHCGTPYAPKLTEKVCSPIGSKNSMANRGWVAEASIETVVARDEKRIA